MLHIPMLSDRQTPHTKNATYQDNATETLCGNATGCAFTTQVWETLETMDALELAGVEAALELAIDAALRQSPLPLDLPLAIGEQLLCATVPDEPNADATVALAANKATIEHTLSEALNEIMARHETACQSDRLCFVPSASRRCNSDRGCNRT